MFSSLAKADFDVVLLRPQTLKSESGRVSLLSHAACGKLQACHERGLFSPWGTNHQRR